ncbi:hypothetical protein CAOG_04279 [Capsaspora owczarzaki ATCC 30864]|uniref:Receptor expression-enhancing protein n=1 Tax=Capsaspora owczarzaki (strain ATCC 30864) TaxID=595528 RepID=A0A0D2X310_CAPO3|nr:hypothetical protein CAOG_04279 [Capsaspora owczarzaki ATCC 30864]KJE93494.1 hypothetical protein CAOG_004279 [Capsaspora owczarzaki ATCC 30864]KJE93495.1 hypothetical protein, variant [Capsaspora owczarzaki ATCC 30864]|eukprot:XP_004348104.2 hypothetical protein CAOG_04279 [Capsaspora owczarzaki ATCC 30864]
MVIAVVSSAVCNVVSVAYPAYASFKAIKTRNIVEYQQWMMYWIVFGFFSVAALVLDALLGSWFPLYNEIKMLFVLWLMLPQTKGAVNIYKHFLHLKLVENEQIIDATGNAAYMAVRHMSLESAKRFCILVQQAFVQALANGQHVFFQQLNHAQMLQQHQQHQQLQHPQGQLQGPEASARQRPMSLVLEELPDDYDVSQPLSVRSIRPEPSHPANFFSENDAAAFFGQMDVSNASSNASTPRGPPLSGSSTSSEPWEFVDESVRFRAQQQQQQQQHPQPPQSAHPTSHLTTAAAALRQRFGRTPPNKRAATAPSDQLAAARADASPVSFGEVTPPARSRPVSQYGDATSVYETSPITPPSRPAPRPVGDNDHVDRLTEHENNLRRLRQHADQLAANQAEALRQLQASSSSSSSSAPAPAEPHKSSWFW